jgi:hypothetical protein
MSKYVHFIKLKHLIFMNGESAQHMTAASCWIVPKVTFLICLESSLQERSWVMLGDLKQGVSCACQHRIWFSHASYPYSLSRPRRQEHGAAPNLDPSCRDDWRGCRHIVILSICCYSRLTGVHHHHWRGEPHAPKRIQTDVLPSPYSMVMSLTTDCTFFWCPYGPDSMTSQ